MGEMEFAPVMYTCDLFGENGLEHLALFHLVLAPHVVDKSRAYT
jgi:hypothetical protein